MKSVIIRPLAVLLYLVPWLELSAQPIMPEPNWIRSEALQVVHRTDTQVVLKPLFQMARTGSNRELLNGLAAIEQDQDLLPPVKDFIVFSFATGLGDLETHAVNTEVLDYLSAYKVKTLVADADHPRMAVALFNTRAAAYGLRNRWDREQAAIQSRRLFDQSADQWTEAFLAASTVRQRGFVDALDFASPGQLHELGLAAVELLHEQPELTIVAAKAGLKTGDFELLLQSIAHGGGPALPGLLMDASRELNAQDSALLLKRVLSTGSETNAALAIAQLAPGRMDQPEVQDMLFTVLADKDLGSAAALVLGSSSNPGIQARLNDIASDKVGLAQQRAAMAISTGRAGRGAEK